MLHAPLVTVNDSNIELQHNLFQTVKTKLHFTLNSLESSTHQIMFAQSLKSIITNQLNQESKIRIHNDINVIVFPQFTNVFLTRDKNDIISLQSHWPIFLIQHCTCSITAGH